MKKYVAAYGSAALLMLLFDVVWIGFVARDLYQQGIGHLMAASPRLDAALLFYAVYALGLLRRALIVHSWSAVCSQADDLFLLAITFSVAAVTLRLRRRAFERRLPLRWIQLQLWPSLGGGNRGRR
jgi:hypothetical protein